jgi:hypothetical protein
VIGARLPVSAAINSSRFGACPKQITLSDFSLASSFNSSVGLAGGNSASVCRIRARG